jgi:hypothetical protein
VGRCGRGKTPDAENYAGQSQAKEEAKAQLAVAGRKTIKQAGFRHK